MPERAKRSRGIRRELRALIAGELFGLALRVDVKATYELSRMIVIQREEQRQRDVMGPWSDA